MIWRSVNNTNNYIFLSIQNLLLRNTIKSRWSTMPGKYFGAGGGGGGGGSMMRQHDWKNQDSRIFLFCTKNLYSIKERVSILKLINSESRTLCACKVYAWAKPHTTGQPMWNVKLFASVGACNLCLTWQWTSKQGICLPESHDHITGWLMDQVPTHQGHVCFF